jgi:transcriptional regulator with XRE-family HTH domain
MGIAPTIGELLGGRLRELRTKRGLTQVQLAERCRVPQSRISAIEKGSHIPNVETVLRLARALGCKVSALMSVFDKIDPSSRLQR